LLSDNQVLLEAKIVHYHSPRLPPNHLTFYSYFNMAVDVEDQNEHDDSGLPGPGAPTPISALEVRLLVLCWELYGY
jgi:hypothetical protein